MDVWDFMLCVCTLLVSVKPSCSSYCYYSHYSGYICSNGSTVGAAIGGGISLIAIIVGLVILYRICKRRRASQGTTFTTGPPITTVMNSSQSQSQSQMSMPNYPQQPVQQVQYPYGQPVQQVQYPYGQPVQQTQIPYSQPQQPNAGYPNMAYNPPS